MADSVEMQDIRGLDIDRAVKGFADRKYMFKKLCNVSSTKSDHIRWFQKTATHLTATSPMNVKNKAMMALPVNLEVTWTQNTDYVNEYMAEGTISEMDIQSAEIDVLARTLQDLTYAVVKQVDADIWNIMTENQVATNINSVTASGAWTGDASTANPIQDILQAKKLIWDSDYSPEGATLILNPVNHKTLLQWLIGVKGSNIPTFSNARLEDGVVMSILGLNVVVSNNVTDPNGAVSGAAVVIPQVACTWKSHTPTTSRVIEEPGLHKKIRVWERGIAYLTDPKAVSFIKGTQ